MNRLDLNNVNKKIKKRNNYLGFLLLILFVFCIVGGGFAFNTTSISKHEGKQLEQRIPFDYNNLPLYAELNEEDVTDLDSDCIGLNLSNDYCTFHPNEFFERFFIVNYYLNDHRNLPIFMSNRSIRI